MTSVRALSYIPGINSLLLFLTSFPSPHLITSLAFLLLHFVAAQCTKRPYPDNASSLAFYVTAAHILFNNQLTTSLCNQQSCFSTPSTPMGLVFQPHSTTSEVGTRCRVLAQNLALLDDIVCVFCVSSLSLLPKTAVSTHLVWI